jgi:hypothetical protein
MWLVLQPREHGFATVGYARLDGKWWLDPNDNPIPGYSRAGKLPEGERLPHNVANPQSAACTIDFTELNKGRRLDGDGFTTDVFTKGN